MLSECLIITTASEMLTSPLRKAVFPAALNAHRRKVFVRRTGGNAYSAAHSVRFRNNNGFRTAEAFALKPEGWLCGRKEGGGQERKRHHRRNE